MSPQLESTREDESKPTRVDDASIATLPGDERTSSPALTPDEESRWTRMIVPLQRAWPVRDPIWAPFGKAPKSWIPDVLLVLGSIVVTIFLLWQSPLVALDAAVREFFYANQFEGLSHFAYIVTYLGSGRFIAPIVLVLAVWCAVRHHSIRPLLMYTFCYLPLGAILAMKHLFGRPLSHHPFRISSIDPDLSILFAYMGKATAYPSGHAANTIVWYGLAVLLLGAAMNVRVRWLVLVAPPVLVLVAQNYIGHHWLSDAPTGFMLGLLILRGVQRVPWATMRLGPLDRFEPAAPGTILGSTALIVGLLLAAALPIYYGLVLGVVLGLVALCWLVLRHYLASRVAS